VIVFMPKIDRTVKLDHAYMWKRGNYVGLEMDEETYRILKSCIKLRYVRQDYSEAIVHLIITRE